jgi:transposase
VCGAAKACIGHETSQVLEFVPARFKVVVYARAKYACRPCEGQVVIAPVAARPFEAGLPGFGLLADVLVRKYADHAPLHRIRGMYRRLEVDLPVSTLAHWVAAGSGVLEPIARAIRRETLLAHVVQADDTGLRVLDPAKKGGSKRGHMWAYVGDRAWATYDYTPTWEAEGPCAFLAERVGWLQADAYAGYDRLFKRPGATAVEVGCFAHARRYFVEALESDRRAAVAIDLIAQLYLVEREASDRGLDPDQRRALRREKSTPILAALGTWVEKTAPAATPKSPLGKGLTYLVNQWRALQRFLTDGRLELDNNACERALRTIAIGRKNWLFAGSDEGAERAAIIYTVFGTCRLHDIDPWAYLQDVLTKLADGWLHSRLAELLPPNWAAARRAAADSDQPAETLAIPA